MARAVEIIVVKSVPVLLGDVRWDDGKIQSWRDITLLLYVTLTLSSVTFLSSITTKDSEKGTRGMRGGSRRSLSNRHDPDPPKSRAHRPRLVAI
jgi:hypothetical protein